MAVMLERISEKQIFDLKGTAEEPFLHTLVTVALPVSEKKELLVIFP